MKKIDLKHPIKFGSETIKSFEIRRPKGKDLRDMPAQLNTGDLLNLASTLSGQPDAVIDELDIEDVDQVLEVVANFMPGGRSTGKRPSR